ncbi:MAG: GerMN domain-containing protein [Candidatus Pacebacteria bacterium]|nr:GerMN domain-containing protein [Candidatus Paceibacterota bacterium]
MKKVFILFIVLSAIVMFIVFSIGQINDDLSEGVGSSKGDISVKLFYYNEKGDIENTCNESHILPVIRKIDKTNTPIKDTINTLLKERLTEEEEKEGFRSEFPNDDFKLLSINLSEGKLILLFSEVPGFTSGGSCRVSILANQIRMTALQFPEVKEVVIKPETLFQP